ncbi:PmbA/TldA family metallopeptidase, partial [Pyramidobacter porci]
MAALEDCTQFLSALPGIDGGDLYFQRSASRSLSYSDGKVEEVSSSSSAGCSARLLRGRSSAFAVVSGVECGGAARALAEAARIASVEGGKVPAMNFPIDRVRAFFPENVDFFGETDRCLRAECGWIRQITLSCSA